MQNRHLYIASVAPTATTSGTDGILCNIIGSASTTIRVHKIVVCGSIATTAEFTRLQLHKRTLTTATVGTSAAITPFALDSRSLAATATANYWSVVGTKGTGGGLIEVRGVLLGLVNSATLGTTLEFNAPNFSDPMLEPWTLRGVLESLEISTVAAVANAPTLSISILFSEDIS